MEQPNDYALVIGVDEYPNYKPLKGPVRDATEFSNWLLDTVHGGGVPAANVHLLTNPDYPVGEITVRLSLIINQIDVARAKGQLPRRFYLYFSGHGQSPKIDEINLCLKMWSATTFSRLALSARDCWSEMVNCVGFPEVAIFLDCCRVWVAGAGGMQPGINCQIPKPSAAGTRIFQAFSSEFLRQSYEAAAVPAGSEEAVEYSGFFTRALMDALKGAAADPAGGVRQENLKMYLESTVPRIAKDARNVVQQPVVEANLINGAVFGCAVPIVQANCTVRFKAPRQGPVVLVYPDGGELTCPNPGVDWVLNLEKGLHQLIDQSQAPPDPLTFRFIPKEEMSHVEF
jgi:hypothetical protein